MLAITGRNYVPKAKPVRGDKTLVVFGVEMRKPSLWTVLCKAYKAWKNWDVDGTLTK
jgi:hypothetical protein